MGILLEKMKTAPTNKQQSSDEVPLVIYATSGKEEYEGPATYEGQHLAENMQNINGSYTSLQKPDKKEKHRCKKGEAQANAAAVSHRTLVFFVVACVTLSVLCIVLLVQGSQQCHQSVENISNTKNLTTASVGTSGHETTTVGKTSADTTSSTTSLPPETTTAGPYFPFNHIRGGIWALTNSGALTVMCPVVFPTNETIEWWVIEGRQAPRLIYTNQNNPSHVTDHPTFRIALTNSGPVIGPAFTVYGMSILNFSLETKTQLYCTNGTHMPVRQQPGLRYTPVLYDIYVASPPVIKNGRTSNATVGDIVEVSCHIDAIEGFFNQRNRNGWWHCGFKHYLSIKKCSRRQYVLRSHKIRDESIGPGMIRRHMFFNLNITGDYPKYVFTCVMDNYMAVDEPDRYQYESYYYRERKTVINVID